MTDLGFILLILTIVGGVAAIIALVQFFTGASDWRQLQETYDPAAPPPAAQTPVQVVQFHLPPRRTEILSGVQG